MLTKAVVQLGYRTASLEGGGWGVSNPGPPHYLYCVARCRTARQFCDSKIRQLEVENSKCSGECLSKSEEDDASINLRLRMKSSVKLIYDLNLRRLFISSKIERHLSLDLLLTTGVKMFALHAFFCKE